MFGNFILSLALLFSVGASSDPITEIKNKDIKDLKLDDKAFEDASAKKPLEFDSEEKAKKYFDEETWKQVAKKVDFEEQKLLLFAWQGSGQDKIDYSVAESYPEQITFEYKPGRTKDLRTHIKIFVIRSNVKWSTK